MGLTCRRIKIIPMKYVPVGTAAESGPCELREGPGEGSEDGARRWGSEGQLESVATQRGQCHTEGGLVGHWADRGGLRTGAILLEPRGLSSLIHSTHYLLSTY